MWSGFHASPKTRYRDINKTIRQKSYTKDNDPMLYIRAWQTFRIIN